MEILPELFLHQVISPEYSLEQILTKGVYKAPANEEILEAVDTSLNLIDSEQDLLNPESINCLRVHPGKGIIIWGARTLSSDPIWRFINIRRLVNND